MPEMDIQREPDESIEMGSLTVVTGDNPDACVIWLHGLGADGHDFEGIVSQLMLPASLSVRFIFPDAPMRPVAINGGYMMRAWYDIFEDISEHAEQDEEGILESAKVISLLIEEQVEQGIDSSRIVLAGFSQGGAVALYTALNHPHPLAGVIALSAYLPLAHSFPDKQDYKDRVPSVFMGHGTQDPVVPVSFGESSRKRLGDLGVSVDWNDYPMEHSVCDEELLAIREWLLERLA